MGCCAYSCFRELNIKEDYVLDRMVGGAHERKNFLFPFDNVSLNIFICSK